MKTPVDWTSRFFPPVRGSAMRMARLALALLAPPRCRVCGAPLLDYNQPCLCPDCVGKIAWIGDGACTGCGFPAGPHAVHGDSCGHCRGRRLSLARTAAVARYSGGARSLALSLKFRHETELAKTMALLMAERFHTAGFDEIDMLIPVPLHPIRMRERGFDQAKLLCAHIGKATGIPMDSSSLTRVRHTEPQALRSRKQRLHNMDNAFAAGVSLSGKKILLVDDVLTTGSTMAACAKACRTAGATRVNALVFAR